MVHRQFSFFVQKETKPHAAQPGKYADTQCGGCAAKLANFPHIAKHNNYAEVR